MNSTVYHLKDIQLVKKKKTILSVPELSIPSGKVTGIIGPNGAGKSTLLKVMAMLEKPAAGRLHFNGEQVYPGKVSIEKQRDVAVVFQQPLMLDTSVYKNVATGLTLRGLPKRVIMDKTYHWLERFGVEHLANRHARTLSGGEAQRVSLARALVTDPKVLFLDEPFSALDLPTKRKLLADFREILQETNISTFFISHDWQEITYLCTDIILLYQSRVIKTLPLDDVELGGLPNELSEFLKDLMTPL